MQEKKLVKKKTIPKEVRKLLGDFFNYSHKSHNPNQNKKVNKKKV